MIVFDSTIKLLRKENAKNAYNAAKAYESLTDKTTTYGKDLEKLLRMYGEISNILHKYPIPINRI